MARVPDVPYQAYPTVTPQGQLPSVNVRTEGRFGENVAGAVEHLGGTLGNVGNELFSRAVAIRDLQDEAVANEASTKQILQGEDAVTKFVANFEGGNATPEALKNQTDALYKIRNDIRQGLTANQQRTYDRQTLTPFRNFIISSSRHAATEQKRYALDTAKANREAIARNVESNPDDDSTVNDSVGKYEESLRQEQKIRGESDVWYENEMAKGLSKIRSSQITGMVHKDPPKAEAMRRKAEEEHSLTQDDSNRVWSKVQTPFTAVIADTHAHNVIEHPEGPGNGASWSPAAVEYERGQNEVATRPMRQLGIDRPDLNIRPAPDIRPAVPGGRGIDFMSNNNDEAAKAIEETASKLGIPLVVGNKGSYVHVELPEDYDTNTAPAPIRESDASRVARAVSSAHGANPENPFQDRATESAAIRELGRQRTQARTQQQDYNYAVAKVAIGQDGERKVQNSREMLIKLQEAYGSTQAWDMLDNKTKEAWMKKLDTQPRRRSDMAHYQEMHGLTTGDENDLNTFMEHDFAHDGLLSEADQRKFIDLQDKKKADPTGDPRINWALRQMDSELLATIPKEDLPLFRGMLQGEIEFQQARTGAFKMTAEDARKMTANLAQKIYTKYGPGLFNLTEVPLSKEEEAKARAAGKEPTMPFYKLEITPKEIEAMKAAAQEARGQQIDDQTARHLIFIERYKDRFGSMPSKNQGRMQ